MTVTVVQSLEEHFAMSDLSTPEDSLLQCGVYANTLELELGKKMSEEYLFDPASICSEPQYWMPQHQAMTKTIFRIDFLFTRVATFFHKLFSCSSVAA